MNSTFNSNQNFVSIIILNYNGSNILLECVESVYQTKHMDFEIILVDNNSSDNSHFQCKKKFPEIKLFCNKENMGLAARNIGIENSEGNFIVFLDSDTIVTPNWLQNLYCSFVKHGEGLYQPKLLEKSRPDFLNSAGNMINIFGLGFSRGKNEKDIGQFNKFQEISYTSGACTFTSKQIIEKIGKINEILFSYHDDLDYGWRGQLLKIPSYYEPKSIVYHLGSPTMKWSGIKFYYLERNRWICLLSLYSTSTLLKISPILFLVDIGIFFYFLTKGFGLEKIKSFFSVIKLYNKITKYKKQVEQLRMISDKDVIEHFVDDFVIPTNLNKTSSSKKINKIIILLSKFTRYII